jgi:HEAT repeat protein
MTPLVAALQDRDISVREAAAKALGWRGAKEKGAIPALIRALKDKYSNDFNVVRNEAMIALGRARTQDPVAIRAILQTLRGEDTLLHKLAAETLQKIGVAALPFLHEAYKDKDQEYRRHIVLVAGLLGNHWDVDIPLLREALKDKIAQIRQDAAMSLRIVKAPSLSIAALKEALKDADRKVRFEAARTLGVLGVHSAALPVLKEAAQKERNALVRLDAARALLRMGENASALAVVEKELEAVRGQGFDFFMLRMEAVRVLATIKTDVASALPLLRKALQDKNTEVRFEAAKAWVALKAERNELKPILLQALQDKERLVRLRAVKHLGEMGARGDFVLPSLVVALQDKEEVIRLEAVKTLEKLGVEAKAAIPALLEALEAKNHEMVALVVKALGKMAAEPNLVLSRLSQVFSNAKQSIFSKDKMRDALKGYGAAALPTLLSALRSPNRAFQEVALVGLGELGEKAKSAIPQMTPFLKEASAYRRLYAARSLAQIGARELALPALMKLLDTQDWGIREDAVKAWKEVGKAAIPALKQALQSESKRVQLEAARVLLSLGEERAASLSVLLRLLEEKDSSLRERAAYSLGELGAAAKEAIPTLERVLRDRKVEIRRTVAEALSRIAEGMAKEGNFAPTTNPASHPASRGRRE